MRASKAATAAQAALEFRSEGMRHRAIAADPMDWTYGLARLARGKSCILQLLVDPMPHTL